MTERMKNNTLKGGIATIGIVGAMVLATGTAHARVSDQLPLSITVCHDLDDGDTPAQEAQMVYDQGGMDSYASGRFVAMGIRDLCPWHRGQGFNQSWPHD
jgi:hypothetical protein